MSRTFYTDPKYVTLLSTMALDGKQMGGIFERLIENDLYIADNFTNIISIWQCNWYYDKNIHGYPMGHMCWLNCEEPINFIKKNYDIIQEFTDLKSDIVNKLPDFDPSNDSVIQTYYDAMTGYVDPSVGITEPLEPIFDIGDYSKGPQLVVSLKDNNKGLVTDPSSWKPLFVELESGKVRIRGIIDELLKSILSTHLLEYHLSADESALTDSLSDYEDELSTSVNIVDLPSKYYLSFNGSEDATGVDYVVDYIRKPIKTSGVVSEYQAIRRWHSGLVEHFGTVSKANPTFALSGFLVVPFDWKYVGDGTSVYEHGGVAEYLKGLLLSVDETESSQISPIDSFINATYTRDSYEIDGKNYAMPFADSSYSVVVSPIYQDLSGISENYLDAKFGSDAIETNWNSNFLTNSINGLMKNRNYCAINLRDSRTVAPYYSYYAVGRGAY